MRIKNDSFLINKPIAHRGIWDDKTAENSFSAFNNAILNNVPIEIDLFLTVDNKIVVFHDDSLFRLTGENNNVYDKTLLELNQLKLLNTEEKIMTFTELLDLINGKIPILIEIKNQPNGKKLIKILIEILKKYKGEFAIQSFNPFYIKRAKKLAPHYIYGILSDKNYRSKNKISQFIVNNMPLNFLIKPDFISVNYDNLPLKRSKTKNKVVIAWTITGSKAETYSYLNGAHNIIYEGFLPKKYS